VETLPTIPEEERRAEDAFWRAFEAARPRILGALLDAVSMALRREHTVHLERLPRMADFAIWATAAEPALGWDDGTFWDAYFANRSDANDIALDASVLAPIVRAMVAARAEPWVGTATELLDLLNKQVDEPVRKQREWPTKPRGLTGMLRRIAPNLRTAGVSITFDREPGGQRRRLIMLARGEKGGKSSSQQSHQTGTSSHPSSRNRPVQGAHRPTLCHLEPAATEEGVAARDDWDDRDDDVTDFSASPVCNSAEWEEGEI
jgi:hypothetical protein